MPLYEYYCPDCKNKFELLVSYKHADDVVCMKCHSEKVRRLLSVFAAQRGGRKMVETTILPLWVAAGVVVVAVDVIKILFRNPTSLT
ncbi:FmdB family zinc ribbon protein [Ktedonobacter robiniae]|uniref:Putative regulatory protein FmdB zinc ribbon domain-containing protein n=1 Tax=Ktedonobacter robiniae TaxID=2778365 RepID=A0ABQ3UM72_9CHLR|nr:hypothetical protein KSB_22650 [Ktedonobacter robiniae]